MKVLAIESSCDETAAAIVEDGAKILSNQVASQVEIHARYGGIVPEVASRQHILSIIPVIEQTMSQAHAVWKDIDAVAVTSGPGLAGSLIVGVNVAKSIALVRRLPITGVNHLEGHIYANWLMGYEVRFPMLCLIVSGGHSDLVLMKGHGDYALLGRTRDDAAGEGPGPRVLGPRALRLQPDARADGPRRAHRRLPALAGRPSSGQRRPPRPLPARPPRAVPHRRCADQRHAAHLEGVALDDSFAH